MKKSDVLFYIVMFVVIFMVLVICKDFKYFVIESGSMQPTLKIGELIVVKEKEQYEVGDIITYYDEKFGGYITHRIIENTRDGKFITKGDFNNVKDEKVVDTKEVVGKVVLHSKILGLVFYQYKTITIVILTITLIVVNLYSIIFKERN